MLGATATVSEQRWVCKGRRDVATVQHSAACTAQGRTVPPLTDRLGTVTELGCSSKVEDCSGRADTQKLSQRTSVGKLGE